MTESSNSRRSSKRIIEDLLLRLSEAEATLEAIRGGQVDAIVVSGPPGEQIYTLSGADTIYRRIAETMNEAALMVTPEGTILFANPQFCALVRSPMEDTIGRPLAGFVDDDDRNGLAALLHQAMERPARRRIVLRAADGSLAPVRAAANALETAEGQAICLVAADLTELEASVELVRQVEAQREALEESEHRYRDLAGRLEERVLERTAQLRHMAFELNHAEQQERRRLAQMLHDDLQQILVGAKLQAGTLALQFEKIGESRGMQNLLDTLEQAIAASRSLSIDLNPPVLYELGLSPALHWLVPRMAERYGLEVQVQTQGDVPADAHGICVLLFTAVRELLLNVVKHSGTKAAKVEMGFDDNDQVRVVVTDEGRGFDPERLGESRGFGLFAIRERLSVLGGRFEIESAPGRGSRFTLVGPIYAPEPVSRPPIRLLQHPVGPAREPRAVGMIRVLVVDDHEIVRRGLVTLIGQQAGIEVVGEACDGIDAIEAAERMRPDIVLMDVSMPRMDGIEATRRIAAQFPEVRVIGLSMYDEADRDMREAGAAAYLNKAGPVESLVATIRSCIAEPAGR